MWSAGCVIYEMVFLKPPFRAEDMEGLYNRVVKGVYQRLPGHYSVDLNEFVGLMLKVNPKARYSAAELLSLPMIIEKINNNASLKESIEEPRPGLLQTIKFPANLQYLTDKLPRPNYEPLKVANLSNFEGFSNLS
jgi:NIMA (never in mitosis gene a)-related kinase 1/4/5